MYLQTCLTSETLQEFCALPALCKDGLLQPSGFKDLKREEVTPQESGKTGGRANMKTWGSLACALSTACAPSLAGFQTAKPIR